MKGRVQAWALLVFLALASVNVFVGLDLPAILKDSWAKRIHYSFAAFDVAMFTKVWAGHLWNVALTLLLLAAAFGWGGVAGRWILRGLPAEGGSADRWLLHLGLGFGFFGLAALGLGLCGLLSSPLAWALAGGGALRLVLCDRAQIMSGLAELGAGVDRTSREARWLLAALALMGVACFLMALAPEQGWDPVYYHLRLPKLYALQHKIYFVPYIYPSHYPQSIEMLYGLAWLLGGEEPAKLINASFWLCCGFALLRLAAPCGRLAALRVTALALTIPLVGTLACQNYIDLGLTFFQLLALHQAWRGRTLAAGIFLGFAMGSKYTGIFSALALAAAMTVVVAKGSFSPHRRGRGKFFRNVFPMVWLAVLPVLPWLGKNFLLTGDPVAPFFYAALGKLEWASGLSQAAMAEVIPKLLPATWAARWEALTVGLWGFLQTRAFAVYSPFVLGMVPLLVWRWTGYAHFLKVYVLVFTVLVLLFAPDGRYWQPAAFPLCILAVLMWQRLAGMGSMLVRSTVSGLAWLSIAFGVLYHVVDMHRMFTVYWVSLGLEPVNIHYMRVRVPQPWYALSINVLNHEVPAGERIAVISDVQAYMLNRDAVFDCDAPGSRRWIYRLIRRHPSEAAIARQFRQWRVRTVFYIRGKAVSIAGGEEWQPREIAAWAKFWNARARLRYHRGDCRVYELGPPQRPGRPRFDLPGPQEWLIRELIGVGEDLPALRERYRWALDAGAESAYLHGVYAELALARGDAPGAVTALRKATALTPEVSTLWFSLAWALIEARQPGVARAAMERGRALRPLATELRELERKLQDVE